MLENFEDTERGTIFRDAPAPPVDTPVTPQENAVLMAATRSFDHALTVIGGMLSFGNPTAYTEIPLLQALRSPNPSPVVDTPLPAPLPSGHESSPIIIEDIPLPEVLVPLGPHREDLQFPQRGNRLPELIAMPAPVPEPMTPAVRPELISAMPDRTPEPITAMPAELISAMPAPVPELMTPAVTPELIAVAPTAVLPGAVSRVTRPEPTTVEGDPFERTIHTDRFRFGTGALNRDTRVNRAGSDHVHQVPATADSVDNGAALAHKQKVRSDDTAGLKNKKVFSSEVSNGGVYHPSTAEGVAMILRELSNLTPKQLARIVNELSREVVASRASVATAPTHSAESGHKVRRRGS